MADMSKLVLVVNIACLAGWAYVLVVVAASTSGWWISEPVWLQVKLLTLALEAACCVEVRADC